jgi:(E)-4-hydroxy-3-methylbut-2-enyl-diphosphate synthase
MEPDKVAYDIILINGPSRRISRVVDIGGVPMGGNYPIRLQSMTTTNTNNADATAEQTLRIVSAGADYVRITAQGVREAENLEKIKIILSKKGISVPLVADIHFNPEAALVAAKYVQKVRINPGNYSDSRSNSTSDVLSDEHYQAELNRVEERFLPLIEECKKRNVAIRIGVNHGSLSDRIMNRFGDTPLGMANSAIEFLHICQRHGFQNIVVSMKASNTRIMVQATRLLVKMMNDHGMDYPLHLGVTEAGEGEEGRIKSAVGIGTLLLDGIGDTIRVSLTEDPEHEIPVAKELVMLFENPLSPQKKTRPSVIPIDPFAYCKRKSVSVARLGGDNSIAVATDLSSEPNITLDTLKSIGWDFNTSTNEWCRSETGADLIFTGKNSFEIPKAEHLPLIGTNIKCNYNLIEYKGLLEILPNEKPYFLLVNPVAVDEQFIRFCKLQHNYSIIFQVDSLAQIYTLRAAIFNLINSSIECPVVMWLQIEATSLQSFQLKSSAMAGALYIDGLCDGLMLSCEGLPIGNIVSTAFGIIQAAGVRVTKTEYISCPGCGRTLFGLNETLKAIKQRTSHLKGLKIGVMGCIVNGPGEMADAHYGYVGAGAQRITLYKGKVVVKRNIPESDALEELISLIKSSGDWIDPPAQTLG